MGLWPTLRGWAAIAVALTALAAATASPGLLLRAFAAGVAALVLASLGSALVAVRGLELAREPAADVRRGQWLDLAVRVTNRTARFRQTLVVVEAVPFTAEPVSYHLVPPLAPHAAVRVPRLLFAARRGDHVLARVALRGGDPAGLFRRQVTWHLPQPVAVHPEVEPLVWLPLRLAEGARAAVVGNPIGLAGVGQDYFGVREYRPTDGMRFVDWRASARHRRLMVREFEENAVHAVSIFLDVNVPYVSRRPAASNFEYLVIMAASLVEYLAGLHCELLFSGGPAGPPIAGPAPTVHPAIMQALARVTPAASDLLAQLEPAVERVPSNSILYCLTVHEPPGLAAAFAALLARGVQIRWVHAPRTLFEGRGDARKMAAIRRFAARGQRPVAPTIVNATFDVASVLMALR